MIADILGVQKSNVRSVANLNERLKASRPIRKKQSAFAPAVSREVLQLCSASLSSISIQRSTDFIRNTKTKQWVWCHFRNSAHPADIHLHHWHLLNDTQPRCRHSDTPLLQTTTPSTAEEAGTDGEQEGGGVQCCQYIASHDYPASAFNKKAIVVHYDPTLHSHLLPQSNWTPWETEYLFYLCELYDLRFNIIFDRFCPTKELQIFINHQKKNEVPFHSKDPAPPFPRNASLTEMTIDALKSLAHQLSTTTPHKTLEQLKDRYYSMSRVILESEHLQRIDALESSHKGDESMHLRVQINKIKDEYQKHPIMRHQYDPIADQQRRAFLNRQFQLSEEERRHDRILLQQLSHKDLAFRKDDAASAKRKRTAASPTGNAPKLTDEQSEQLPLEAVRNHLNYHRRPGPILASQMMQQFASPLLLAPPTSASTSAHATSTVSGGPNHSSGGATSGSQSGRHSGQAIQVLKKHENEIEAELRNLGFGTPGLPLWPNYVDSDIVQAFNALRIEVATLVHWNLKVAQLEKERLLWKGKVMQIKEEQAPIFSSPASRDDKKQDGHLAHLGLVSAHMGMNKKNHIRQSLSSDKASLKKPRKSSKKPISPK